MSLNYRIVREVYGRGHPDPHGRPAYTIREVYYAGPEDTPASWSDPVTPGGESVRELQNDVDRMALAWTRPVLVVRGYVLLAELPLADADLYQEGMRRTE